MDEKDFLRLKPVTTLVLAPGCQGFKWILIAMSSNYFSCFSGIGGLEGTSPAVGYCEIDPEAQKVLKKRFPSSKLYHDIRILENIDAEIIVGGWPCQDISVAGRGRGLKGENSGLFYELLRLAKNSEAKTIVAENVANVLHLSEGQVFKEILRELIESGFKTVSWRTLNARQFGLPHHRNRVFFVASKDKDIPLTIFRKPSPNLNADQKESVCGFYWTAGTHSLNYSNGYVPTIKVGSSVSIPSPPAIHYRGRVRMLSPDEALALQGFESIDTKAFKAGSIYRLAGNAVAAPVGRFVLDGVLNKEMPIDLKIETQQLSLINDSFLDSDETIPPTGLFDGELVGIKTEKIALATNLDQYIDFGSVDTLSIRAAKGLLSRIERSNTFCPPDLKRDLEAIIYHSKNRT